MPEFDPAAMPIVSLALSSNTLELVELTALADETVRRRLESVRGVGEVRVAGGLAREIRVDLLPDRLRAVGITVPEVMGALQSQNLEVPAGRVERGGFRAPMTRAVIGGLITSTMLTLVVVPVAYTYFDDLGDWVKRRFVSKEREQEILEERERAGLEPEPAWGD